MNWKQYKPKEFEYNGKWIKNWFSNMVPCEIEIDGLKYNSVENYFQAMKVMPFESTMHVAIALATPSRSKQLGRQVELRPDWNDIKYEVMKRGLLAKWSKPEYRDVLLATGDEIIIEWNNWGDRIWGVDIRDDEGLNLLGKALMEIREELRTNKH